MSFLACNKQKEQNKNCCVNFSPCSYQYNLFCFFLFHFAAALHPRRPYGLLGTGSPGCPPLLSHSFWALLFFLLPLQMLLKSTETIRIIRDLDFHTTPEFYHFFTVWFPLKYQAVKQMSPWKTTTEIPVTLLVSHVLCLYFLVQEEATWVGIYWERCCPRGSSSLAQRCDPDHWRYHPQVTKPFFKGGRKGGCNGVFWFSYSASAPLLPYSLEPGITTPTHKKKSSFQTADSRQPLVWSVVMMLQSYPLISHSPLSLSLLLCAHLVSFLALLCLLYTRHLYLCTSYYMPLSC